ncbi:hypothetical protein CRM22_010339 [Opisthorchis felineus]|uniref:Uncharacterized protein n=1 Tax=Opisthorchis felineus TaxID=147828 RepID=A0A4S2KZJ5_OPIFE|nr:hypothetical protein CRM22_010339 [Opisthorchis felineus]TGZ55550.1 hypothetical protein CRM22_010339 [Opisthorchis felineus]TGZ55551.1 hypothetical protein CRM22_010339 [Opisthorchis felineus]TGZ55552.1 hypothetical protein CRM22_010339 [Opisthorchis felineus]
MPYHGSKQFNLCPEDVPRGLVIVSSVLLLVAVMLGLISATIPDFIFISPKSTQTGLKDDFSKGYTQICFKQGGCQDLPMKANGDVAFNRITGLRVAAYGLHIFSLLVDSLVLIGIIVIIVFWYKKDSDLTKIRIARLSLGIALMIGGMLLQLAVLLFHIEQFEDKWLSSPELPYGFNQWAVDQRTTTEINFGTSYVLLWVATLLTFVCSWILIGSFYCWSYQRAEERTSEISIQSINNDDCEELDE